MSKKIFIIGFILIMSFFLFSGCRTTELKQGEYISEDGIARVTLSNNNEFKFISGVASSYVPTGNYIIKNGKLILHVSDNEEYVFKIKGEKIVFESGSYGNTIISKETVFSFVD